MLPSVLLCCAQRVALGEGVIRVYLPTTFGSDRAIYLRAVCKFHKLQRGRRQRRIDVGRMRDDPVARGVLHQRMWRPETHGLRVE